MVRYLIFAMCVSLVSLAWGAETPSSKADPQLRPFRVSVMEPPAAALDLRGVFDGPRGEQLPAVRVEDGRFVAGGEPVRFWGVNFCFGACFPTHEQADRLAARLAGYGVNCVRLHHMDMQAFPRGIWTKDFAGFDPEALDRLDYLLAAFKREGVYANINLHVSRDFTKTGSTYAADSMPPFGKQVCILDPTLIELQKRYARDLLGRVNPYTKLRYAADPVVAMVEISNENSIFLSLSKRANYKLAPQFETVLTQKWEQFLLDKYGDKPSIAAAWAQPKSPEVQPVALDEPNLDRLRRADITPGRRSEDYVEFMTQIDMEFFVGMRNFLREELGVQCPITGTEGFTLPSDYVQSHLDYVDAHAYWQHPKFPGDGWNNKKWTIENTAMVDEPTIESKLLFLTFQRMLNPDGSGRPMPFTVSEYNHPSPNDYQAEAIPMVASFAAAQDWDGIFLFAYKHNDRWDQDYVSSYFDIHANPVKMVQLMAGALLFRRGDIRPLDRQVTTHIPPQSMYELSAQHLPWTDQVQTSQAIDAPAAKRFFGRYAIAPYAAPDGADSPTVITPSVNGAPWTQPGAGTRMVSSDSKLAWTSSGPRTGRFTAEDARGKVWVGFRPDKAEDGDGYDVSVQSPEFAAVTLSPLDGKPLDRSARILITACGRVENTDQMWNEDRTSVSNQWGHAPTLIETVVAEVRLPHVAATARLTALGGDGKPAQSWPVQSADGEFSISLGRGPATLWYLLEVQ